MISLSLSTTDCPLTQPLHWNTSVPLISLVVVSRSPLSPPLHHRRPYLFSHCWDWDRNLVMYILWLGLCFVCVHMSLVAVGLVVVVVDFNCGFCGFGCGSGLWLWWWVVVAGGAVSSCYRFLWWLFIYLFIILMSFFIFYFYIILNEVL